MGPSMLVKSAADALGLQLRILDTRTTDDFDSAFAALVKLHAGGLVIGNDPLYATHQEQLATASAMRCPPFRRRESSLRPVD
jgi:hypothetical protein